MSTYRIFERDSRISTGYVMKDGSFHQTFPKELTFTQMSFWMLSTLEGKTGVFTVGYPDGTKKTFYPEKYTLFQNGRCVSAGTRLCGHLMRQRYPVHKTYESADSLVCSKASYYGGSTYLSIKSKAPLVTDKPMPERRLSRWAKMTDEERNAWKHKMRMARTVKVEPLLTPGLLDVRALGEQGLAEDDGEDEHYGEEDFQRMHPTMAMALRHLTERYGPIRNFHEGCDCGNC